MTDSSHHHPPARPLSEIDSLANQYAADLLELDPSSATMLGHEGVETEYPDYSPAGVTTLDQLNAALLVELNKLTEVDEVDVVTKAALRERVGLMRELTATQRTELNNLSSAAQGIRSVLDMMPTDTPEQWGHIIGRLENLPAALAGYQESLRTSAVAGQTPAQRQIDTVISQSVAHGQAGGFFPGLVQRAKKSGALDDQLQARLETTAHEAAGAYRDFADFLDAQLRPTAPEDDAVGREFYELASREFLGATIDVAETYEWGLAELDRIVAQQQEVAHQIKSGATIDEARHILNHDPARQLHGTDALQQWMQRLSDEAIEEMKAYFDIPAPMDRVECLIAPTQEGGVYYTGPSEDFSRPGRMWWSVPAGEETFTTWQQTTTVYHEGVPGHHLQVGTSMLAADELNDWRRHWLWTSGHGEGWALYAEGLMQEFGFLDDPGDLMGMLEGQRLRAARVVFDIGVHCRFNAPARYGGGPWTAEQGFAFLQDHIYETPQVLQFEFTRYLGWPGQAPSYKIGQRIWEGIRAEHEARARAAGQDFDLRAFHTRALRLGSMGLDTLQQALAQPGV